MTSSQPTQPLTDAELETIRKDVESNTPTYASVTRAILFHEVVRLRAENAAQAERIGAVMELHRPVNHRGVQVCNICTPLAVLMQTKEGRGRHGVEHPCPTRRALGLDQNGNSNG